jgi:hypothetical protein
VTGVQRAGQARCGNRAGGRAGTATHTHSMVRGECPWTAPRQAVTYRRRGSLLAIRRVVIAVGTDVGQVHCGYHHLLPTGVRGELGLVVSVRAVRTTSFRENWLPWATTLPLSAASAHPS